MLGFEHSSLIHVLRAISVYVNEAENWHGVPCDSSHICGFDVQARPKVDDKDGGSYTGEWLGAAMVSTPGDDSEAKKLLAMIPGCWRHGKGIQAPAGFWWLAAVQQLSPIFLSELSDFKRIHQLEKPRNWKRLNTRVNSNVNSLGFVPIQPVALKELTLEVILLA